MPNRGSPRTREQSTAQAIRARIEQGGPRLWKYSDFEKLPPSAVATALSRLSKEGVIKRVSKGVYYRSVPTAFGASIPAGTAVSAATLHAPLYPAGLSAANLLGLSTQNPRRSEYATTAPGSPTALRDALVHTGRSPQRAGLSTEEGAILETLRDRARSSDLSQEQTTKRLLRLMSDEKRFHRLAKAAMAEPPRVRAALGALGQELDMPTQLLGRLRKSLNPLSRFDFGRLASLKHAKEWQAK